MQDAACWEGDLRRDPSIIKQQDEEENEQSISGSKGVLHQMTDNIPNFALTVASDLTKLA